MKPGCVRSTSRRHLATAVSYLCLLSLLLFLAACTTQSATVAEPTVVEPTLPPPTETAVPPTETAVLEEGESNCELVVEDAMEVGVERYEEVLGGVIRGEVIWGEFNCPGLWDNARFVGLQDAFGYTEGGKAESDPTQFVSYHEFMPEAGGGWKGPCDLYGPVARCTLEGDGINEGLQLTLETTWETMTANNRKTQGAGE
jgi:hypothetical protein